MGSADEVPQGPTEKVVFEEDLTDNQLVDMGVVRCYRLDYLLRLYTDCG